MKKECKNKRNRLLKVWIGILAVGLLVFPGFYNRLTIRHYEIEAEQIGQDIRIVMVSDLHSCKYGKKMEKLVSAIRSQNPDIVVLTGDFFDDQLSDVNAEILLQEIADQYPCYYVTGNHEYWNGEEAFLQKMAILDQYGVRRLAGELYTIRINKNVLNICGIDDPEAYLLYAGEEGFIDFSRQMLIVKEKAQNGNYTILLSHRPEFFEYYAENGFDLVLCGHAHGGQWRIPGLINGVYAPNQGFFPKYAGGVYQKDGTTMVVSRGLARESTRIFRFYNPPELVVLDLK